MSSLLDTSCINARQLSACVLREKTGAVQLLKLSLGIFLLLAALCVLPAGAESFESDGLPERNYPIDSLDDFIHLIGTRCLEVHNRF